MKRREALIGCIGLAAAAAGLSAVSEYAEASMTDIEAMVAFKQGDTVVITDGVYDEAKRFVGKTAHVLSARRWGGSGQRSIYSVSVYTGEFDGHAWRNGEMIRWSARLDEPRPLGPKGPPFLLIA